MADVAFVFLGVLLVVLRLGSVAQVDSNLTDLVEPLALVVAMIVGIQIPAKDLLSVFIADFFRDGLFDPEVLIEEVADELEDLPCEDQVLTGFLAVTAQIQDLGQIVIVVLMLNIDIETEIIVLGDEE